MKNVRSKITPCFIAFLFSFVYVTAINAQDSLFLRNGDHIIGLVNEVDKQSIKYKNPANPNGPSYVIERCSVRQIVYQNGHKDEFVSCNAVQKPKTKIGENNWLTVHDLPNSSPITYRSRSGDIWGLYAINGIDVPRKTISDIMKRDNPQAYAHFQKASKQMGYMIPFAILAGGLAGVGVVYFDQSTSTELSEIKKRDKMIAGVGFCLAGVAAFIPGINLAMKSHRNEQKAVLLYNDGLRDGTTHNRLLGQKSQQPKLMLGAMPNGIGVGLRF